MILDDAGELFKSAVLETKAGLTVWGRAANFPITWGRTGDSAWPGAHLT